MRTCLAVLITFAATSAHAFCGFYVAKGDAQLFNKASQVVIARDGDRVVMTMANDFRGEPRDFAVVIPVPTVITRGQIRVSDKAVVNHLDAYSAPRLVEYLDPDPCSLSVMEEGVPAPQAASAGMRMDAAARRKSLGVTIEASYTVGEYDILILSAAQSDGLETWLRQNGYQLPRGASSVLASYIRQKMKFFVAKVNVGEQEKLGINYLRPLSVAYESPKFMLPIRLGTVNAQGTQELFVYTLTRKGRVETTNYRTVRLPSDVELPVSVKTDFAPFYKAMFSEQVRREEMSTVFLEYAWDMNWCDPCAAEPLSRDELKKLGVFWLTNNFDRGGAADVFITRLHVRYDAAHFPEDLVFQETGNRENFQARYIVRHPWTGDSQCDAATAYRRQLRERQQREAQNLARLTGRKAQVAPVAEKKWWEW